jgi:hypothetical protein
MSEHLTYLEDGWVLWSRVIGGTTEGLRVWAQLFTPRDGGPSEIVHLVVEGRKLTTEKLRSIPLGHIETVANTNTDPQFGPHPEGPPQSKMSEELDAFLKESDRSILTLAHRRQRRKPLSRPDGSNPDAFYEQVAEAYREVVQNTRKVAVVLAEEADVPVGTVHRWILEARRRGFLPTARQGRAG